MALPLQEILKHQCPTIFTVQIHYRVSTFENKLPMEASDVWVTLWQPRRHIPGRAGGAILQHSAGNRHEGDGLDAVPRSLVRPQEAWAVASYQEVFTSQC